MKISIVTIAKNPGAAVGRTLHSVAACTYPSLEWIYIDGASDDGSVATVCGASRPPDILVSEPDHGIADAFNKGLARANGDAVLFLNAGDALHAPGALSELVAAWRGDQYAWITGGAEVRREDGTVLYRRAPASNDFRALLAYHCGIWHNATLCRTELLREVGGFSTAYRISMDYDLWLRLYRQGCAPQVCDVIVADFYVGGASGRVLKRVREEIRVRKCNGYANPWPIEAGILLRGCLKSICPKPAWAYRVKERLGW